MTDQNTHCIVCGKAIPKRTKTLWFRAPRSAIVAHSPFMPDLPAIPDGTREVSTSGYMVNIYTSTWDGESYRDRFFCKDGCAIKQGYAAAFDGHRWKWRKRDDT